MKRQIYFLTIFTLIAWFTLSVTILQPTLPTQAQGFNNLYLPLINNGEAAPLQQSAPLLATGQTQGYRGNNGVPADGNRDDGDLMRGRLQSYEYSSVSTPTTQAENIVLDTNTGLMWIRDMQHLTGDDPAGVGGNVQLNQAYRWSEALAKAQELVYGGHDDWRLPMLKEMQTLVNYGRSVPSINTDVFPTALDDYPNRYFWTTTTYFSEPHRAYYVNFLNGHTWPFAKETGLGLRPVRTAGTTDPIDLLRTGQTTIYQGDAGETGTGTGDDGDLQLGLQQSYEYSDDGVIDTEAENMVTERNTKLMWIRDPLLITDLSAPLDWQTSIDRVNQLNYGGYNDWRMPNIVELESVSQAGRANTTVDPVVFPNLPTDPNDPEAAFFWSSTTSAFDKDDATPGSNGAWYVTTVLGSTNFGNPPNAPYDPAKSRPGYVRPVRDINASTETPRYRSQVETVAEFQAVTQASTLADVQRAGKFMLAVESNAPFTIAYQDVNRYPLHYEFLVNTFPENFAGLTVQEYTALVSRRATRGYFAGNLRSFENAQGQLVYGFEIYTDPSDERELLTEQETAALYAQLAETMKLRPLVYSPTQPAALALANSWTDPAFPIDYPAPATSPDYEAYITGQTYGVIRLFTLEDLIKAGEDGDLSRQEIVVIDSAPTDLESIVAGIVTGARQGDLSHLNIRAARRGTPNAYVKESHAAFKDYDGQLVRLSVTRQGYRVESDVELAVAEQWWAASRPLTVTLRPLDNSHTALDDLTIIGADDVGGLATTRFGGKAANLARLYQFLPAQYQVPGMAVPFHFYTEFMENNTHSSGVTYAKYLAALHTDETFRTDSQARAKQLKDFRDEMRADGIVSPNLVSALVAQIDAQFGAQTMVRFRSSSNAEDGLEFNGAGLYDSTSVCVDDSLDDDSDGPSHCDPNQNKERTIERALKKVWASLWNFRAWEERDYYGIDHLAAGMAVLITPAFPDERANGVAFTGDPAGAGSDDYIINVQQGDFSVVLPEPGVVPERTQLAISDGEVTNITRLRASSLITTGHVLSDDELRELGSVMAVADSQYPINVGNHSRDDILLDLEFKIRREDDGLVIKQIRPFLRQSLGITGQSPTLRVHVPETLSLCGGWRESAGLRRELDEQARLTLLAGDVIVPLAGAGSSHALFGELAFGPSLQILLGQATGTIDVQESDDGQTSTVTLERLYMLDDGEVAIQLMLPNIASNEFDIRWLDQANLLQRLRMTGELRAADGTVTSRLSFVPCDYATLPLVTFDVALANGQHMVIEQRRERNDGLSGLAGLIHAEVTLAAGSRTISDYGQLVYAADRHHWNEQFWVLFDTPLGDAHGVGLYQQFTGSGEPVYQAVLLDEALETLREVEVESVARVDPILSSGGLILELGQGADVVRTVVDTPSDLTIACPVGVICDGDYTYRAHEYRDEHVSIYMSFHPEIVDSYSLSSLMDEFSYLNLRIMFPERATENSSVYFSSLNPLRVLGKKVDLHHTDGMLLELISYENGRLRGMAQGIITDLTIYTEDRDDPTCITGDIVGMCYEDESVYQPFVLHFNLLVEESK